MSNQREMPPCGCVCFSAGHVPLLAVPALCELAGAIERALLGIDAEEGYHLHTAA